MPEPNYLRKNTEIVKGNELWLFIGTTSATKPTCFAMQHSLNRSLSLTDVSTKDSGDAQSSIPGESSWTASTEALIAINNSDQNAMDFVEIMDAYDTKAPVYVTFGKLSNYNPNGIVDKDDAQEWAIGTPNWTGKGYINSLQASGNHGGLYSYTILVH